MNILDKILFLIKKNGMSEIEFCSKVGLSKATVSDWKAGRTKSYNRHIPQIAKILGVSEEYLLLKDIDTEKTEPINAPQKQQVAITINPYGGKQDILVLDMEEYEALDTLIEGIKNKRKKKK